MDHFKYLTSIISKQWQLDRVVNERIGKIDLIFNILKSTFLGKREVSIAVKRVIKPTLLVFASELRTITEMDKNPLNATEMR